MRKKWRWMATEWSQVSRLIQMLVFHRWRITRAIATILAFGISKPKEWAIAGEWKVKA